MKSKTHKVTLTLRFDKPCTKAAALAAAHDCIVDCGTYYPTSYKAADPEQFTVSSAK